MDFRMELAKWGYNKGNSIDVEILIEEILPSLFPQQQGYSEEEVVSFIHKFLKEHQPQLPYLIGRINMWFKQFKKK